MSESHDSAGASTRPLAVPEALAQRFRAAAARGGFRAVADLDDDALVAAIAASEGVVVLAAGDESLPTAIEVFARRARIVCNDGNGVHHSPRERRVAALALIAAIQHAFDEPAALGLIAGDRRLLAVVPISRIEPSFAAERESAAA